MNVFVTRVLQAVLDADAHRFSQGRGTRSTPTELRRLKSQWGTLSLVLPVETRTRVLSRFIAVQSRSAGWLQAALVAGEVSVAQVTVFAGQLCGATLPPRLAQRLTSQINWEIAGSIRRQMLREHPWLNSLERVHARALHGEEEE